MTPLPPRTLPTNPTHWMATVAMTMGTTMANSDDEYASSPIFRIFEMLIS
jgi:hypothetical protein